MRLKIGFCHDLTKPDADTTVLGILVLDNDRFLDFEWALDPVQFDVGLFAREIVATTPDMLKLMVEEDWPQVREHARERWSVTNCGEFVAYSLRHSSIYVMSLEHP